MAGEYNITLSLIDVSNTSNNNVITTETITIEVSDVEQPDTGTTGGTNGGTTGGTATDNTTNNSGEGNAIQEIPKAGMSYAEMIIWVATLLVAISAGYIIFQRKVSV